MGLDIIAMDFPKEAKEPIDVPKGWQPPVIGIRDALQDQIKKTIPLVEFSSSGSGLIVGDDFALEIRLKTEECNSIIFTARGNEKAVGAALDICRLFGIRCIECAESSFVDANPERAHDALEQWREYLEGAISRRPEPSSSKIGQNRS
jgi:hypothetical protein